MDFSYLLICYFQVLAVMPQWYSKKMHAGDDCSTVQKSNTVMRNYLLVIKKKIKKGEGG